MSPREEADKITSQITLLQDLESQTVRLPGWDHLACFLQVGFEGGGGHMQIAVGELGQG